jgi:hypothetical protein
MNKANTIDEVLNQLDLIIEETVVQNNFLGVFAYIYRRTTEGVKDAILDKRFEDNARMEKMDVTFANFYIQAYHNYTSGGEVSESWRSSFDAKDAKITIIQHVLLGMNAHINLDLGQAAAISCPGEEIFDLKHDFMEVNNVLADLTDVMQRKLGKVSPLMFILDWAGKRSDEILVNFSMIKARDQAWNLAEELALAKDQVSRKARVTRADKNVSTLSKIIKAPPGKVLPFLLNTISIFEEKNVGKIIDQLKS